MARPLLRPRAAQRGWAKRGVEMENRGIPDMFVADAIIYWNTVVNEISTRRELVQKRIEELPILTLSQRSDTIAELQAIGYMMSNFLYQYRRALSKIEGIHELVCYRGGE